MAKQTRSLCPECLAIIDASIKERDGKMMIEKTCDIHGHFEDIYWSDLEQFKRFEEYWYDGKGLDNPNILSDEDSCPNLCGLCKSHKTTTILANIDVTNRCNQKCPTCFANASSGYIYEPSIEQISDMMHMLRNEKPVPCPAIQLSGGEPTMRKDIVEIVKMASDFKFAQIQMATNGIKLAKDLTLCRDLADAGLNTVYLQFDGVTEKPYKINRGYNALPIKLDAINNCRLTGLNSIVLVPTVAKGINDDQLGDIIKFSVENMDVIKGVNFQPVSFTGRITKTSEERKQKRITIPDLLKCIEKQTNKAIKVEDFYPVPFVIPISRFNSVQKETPTIEFSVHPHCGAGTYIYVDIDDKYTKKIIPITRFIDVEGLIKNIDKLASYENKMIGKYLSKAKRIGDLAFTLPKYVNKEKAPKLVKELINIFRGDSKKPLREFHRNTIFVGIMHFMDLYNIDLERTKRCGIHYATPDRRIIPFCTYNTIYREEVEKNFRLK